MAKFQKGESGNPKGRPVGIRDRRTCFREMFEEHSGALISKAVEMALDGDMAALKICIDRIAPPLKATDSGAAISLVSNSLTERGEEVLENISSGAITIVEAQGIMKALQAQSRLVEVDELLRRGEALENAPR